MALRMRSGPVRPLVASPGQNAANWSRHLLPPIAKRLPFNEHSVPFFADLTVDPDALKRTRRRLSGYTGNVAADAARPERCVRLARMALQRAVVTGLRQPFAQKYRLSTLEAAGGAGCPFSIRPGTTAPVPCFRCVMSHAPETHDTGRVGYSRPQTCTGFRPALAGNLKDRPPRAARTGFRPACRR